MEIESHKYILDFMKEMQKPLNSSKIHSSAHLLQLKNQEFPSIQNGFSLNLFFSFSAPILNSEPTGLNKEHPVIEKTKKENFLFNTYSEDNLIQRDLSGQKNHEFMKNNLESNRIASSNTYLKTMRDLSTRNHRKFN